MNFGEKFSPNPKVTTNDKEGGPKEFYTFNDFLALLNSICNSSSAGRVNLYLEAKICFASFIYHIRASAFSTLIKRL